MKRFSTWQLVLGSILILLSLCVYLIHYLLFRDAHHIFIYLVGDIAFVFIEVLLVTMGLNGLLNYRNRQELFKKLNMVIGAFFSETGRELIVFLAAFDAESFKIADRMVVTNEWSKDEFLKIQKFIDGHSCAIDHTRGDWKALKDFLIKKRNFLLGLLENSNLLEHESFTNLLWAVFHLTEELANRDDFSVLPQTDYQHLAGDIKRAHLLLLSEWLSYMKHLKQSYPYLFSLEMRRNPFDKNASIIVR